MKKQKLNKKLLIAAIALTVGTSTVVSAAESFGVDELNTNSLISCKEGKCGEAFCATKKTKSFLKKAGVSKKIKIRKESKCGSESKCGEAFCATKKTKSFLKEAGSNKKMK